MFLLDLDICKSVEYTADEHLLLTMSEYIDLLDYAQRMGNYVLQRGVTESSDYILYDRFTDEQRWILSDRKNWNLVYSIICCLYYECVHRFGKSDKVKRVYEKSLTLVPYVKPIDNMTFDLKNTVKKCRKLYIKDVDKLNWTNRDKPYWLPKKSKEGIMGHKYYAVRKGRNVGIFEDWGTAQKSVSGFSGAEFKKFTTREQAQDYINAGEFNPYVGQKRILPPLSSNAWHIYIDGSYNSTTGEVGSGIVYLDANKKFVEGVKHNWGVQKLTGNNVVGELFGSIMALTTCHKAGIKEVYIYHDYVGVANFINGSYRPKSDVAKYYVSKYKELSKFVTVRFVHVDAHTGVEYNELADKLAKESVGLL